MTKQRSKRVPFTTDELRKLVPSEMAKLKLTDDEKSRLRQINQERQRERAIFVARLRVEQEPLLEDLRKVGLELASVWDLVNTSDSYPMAVPILLKHLTLPYNDEIRGGIARALAVREARFAFPILVAEYRRAPEGGGLGAKDGLAVALSATVTSETLEEMIALAKDPINGRSRVLLLYGLRKFKKKPEAKEAIKDLANDPDLAKEIASWRKGER